MKCILKNLKAKNFDFLPCLIDNSNLIQAKLLIKEIGNLFKKDLGNLAFCVLKF